MSAGFLDRINSPVIPVTSGFYGNWVEDVRVGYSSSYLAIIIFCSLGSKHTEGQGSEVGHFGDGIPRAKTKFGIARGPVLHRQKETKLSCINTKLKCCTITESLWNK